MNYVTDYICALCKLLKGCPEICVDCQRALSKKWRNEMKWDGQY